MMGKHQHLTFHTFIDGVSNLAEVHINLGTRVTYELSKRGADQKFYQTKVTV